MLKQCYASNERWVIALQISRHVMFPPFSMDHIKSVYGTPEFIPATIHSIGPHQAQSRIHAHIVWCGAYQF
jgi:hypothetical protein